MDQLVPFLASADTNSEVLHLLGAEEAEPGTHNTTQSVVWVRVTNKFLKMTMNFLTFFNEDFIHFIYFIYSMSSDNPFIIINFLLSFSY